MIVPRSRRFKRRAAQDGVTLKSLGSVEVES
jgi:hypothetical protein